MVGRKKWSIATILIIIMLSSIGFADTGKLINNFNGLNRDGIEVKFQEEEEVNIDGETKDTYIVEKDSKHIEIPKEHILKTKKYNSNYVVVDETTLLDKPDESSKVIKVLKVGETVTLTRKIDDKWGIFVTKDMNKGFGELKYFNGDSNEEDFITCGISNISKVIKYGGNKYFVLENGETIPIKDYMDKKFIVLDEDGKEFSIPKEYIKLNNGQVGTTRNIISRKTSNLNKVITDAHSKIGSPYVYADMGNRGYDCSGFTCSVYNNIPNVEKLNRSSKDQVRNGIPVNRSELRPGDLLFFNTSGKGISHVGIYIGDAMMIHASSGKNKVIITDINSKYYSSRYVTARRIITK